MQSVMRKQQRRNYRFDLLAHMLPFIKEVLLVDFFNKSRLGLFRKENDGNILANHNSADSFSEVDGVAYAEDLLFVLKLKFDSASVSELPEEDHFAIGFYTALENPANMKYAFNQ